MTGITITLKIFFVGLVLFTPDPNVKPMENGLLAILPRVQYGEYPSRKINTHHPFILYRTGEKDHSVRNQLGLLLDLFQIDIDDLTIEDLIPQLGGLYLMEHEVSIMNKAVGNGSMVYSGEPTEFPLQKKSKYHSKWIPNAVYLFPEKKNPKSKIDPTVRELKDDRTIGIVRLQQGELSVLDFALDKDGNMFSFYANKDWLHAVPSVVVFETQRQLSKDGTVSLMIGSEEVKLKPIQVKGKDEVHVVIGNVPARVACEDGLPYHFQVFHYLSMAGEAGPLLREKNKNSWKRRVRPGVFDFFKASELIKKCKGGGYDGLRSIWERPVCPSIFFPE